MKKISTSKHVHQPPINELLLFGISTWLLTLSLAKKPKKCLCSHQGPNWSHDMCISSHHHLCSSGERNGKHCFRWQKDTSWDEVKMNNKEIKPVVPAIIESILKNVGQSILNNLKIHLKFRMNVLDYCVGTFDLLLPLPKRHLIFHSSKAFQRNTLLFQTIKIRFLLLLLILPRPFTR